MADEHIEMSVPMPARFSDAEHALHAEATARTGLTDFGNNAYLAPLRFLLQVYDNEAHFTPAGRERAFDLVVQSLVGRLVSEKGWRDHPECLETEIRRPLVITGIPRSGTTALHKLMFMDPQFQGLEHWLSRTPVVRPPREQWESHPLYQRSLAALDAILNDQPLLKAAHGQAVDEVDECYNLLMQSFVVGTFSSMAHAPSYDTWYYAQDETPSYRRFLDNLKLIGSQENDRRWLLKNPNHIFAIDALLNVMPDAMIVQTHRNPVEAIPSLCSTGLAGRRFYEGQDTNPFVIGARYNHHWHLAITRVMKRREREPNNFFDVRFRDFLADPLRTVRAIYQRFGLVLEPAVERDMQQWLADNPRNKLGEHRYSLEQFGLNAQDIHRQYREYIECYGL